MTSWVNRAERRAIVKAWPRLAWPWRDRKKPFRWCWFGPVVMASVFLAMPLLWGKSPDYVVAAIELVVLGLIFFIQYGSG